MVTDKWQIGQKDTGYVCEYVMGKTRGTYPRLHCLDEMEEGVSDFIGEMPERTAFDDYFE